MKFGKNGSFTAEATIVVTVMIIILFVMIQAYLNQFIIQYARTGYTLQDCQQDLCEEKGLYFDYYVDRAKVSILDEDKEMIESYDESLNYLFLMHSYLILDELGEEAWDGLKAFKE